MKLCKSFSMYLLVMLIVSACSSVLPIASPMNTPFPTKLVDISSKTRKSTNLYSGPGNQGFETIANFPSGTDLVLLGVFGKYTKVHDQISNKDGFVISEDLIPVNESLDSLILSEVPWVVKDLSDYCAMPFSKLENGKFIITNPTSDLVGIESGKLILTGPVKFKFKMSLNTDRTAQISIIKPFVSNFGTHEWYQTTRFYLKLSDQKYSLVIYDGKGLDSVYQQELPFTSEQTLIMTLEDPMGKKLTIADESGDTKIVINVPLIKQLSLPDGLFPEKVMHINCEVDTQSVLQMDQHVFEMAPSGSVQHDPATIPSLRELGEQRGITIGAVMDWWNLVDSKSMLVSKKTFGLDEITYFGWPSYWIAPGVYNYAYLDPIVDFYINNGWKVRALHLVYGDSNILPDWLKNGNFTREEYINLLESFVKDNVNHYKGKITEYSLANKAVNAYGSNNDFWANVIGWDYVDMVFRWAREADPNAVLILNADSDECIRDENTRANVNRLLSWVRRMKNNGVPIDGVGLEMHLLLPWNSHIAPSKECMVETMNQYSSLGVNVYITELDLNTTLLSGNMNEVLTQEGEIYKSVMDACLESQACKGVATFGVDDDHNWLASLEEVYQNIDQEHYLVPLLFDADYELKPAYFGFLESLQTH